MAEQKKEATKAGVEKPAKKDKPGLFKRIAKFFRCLLSCFDLRDYERYQ